MRVTEIKQILDDRRFITRPQILSLGLDDDQIAAYIRHQLLVRIGPGLYAGTDYLRLPATEQHIVRCHAVATRFDDRIAFSHESAALLHGLPVWGTDLEHVHVTRLDGGRSRHHAGVAHHVRHLLASHLVEVDGLTVVDPARTVWDIATSSSIESALVTADGALNLSATTSEQLRVQAESFGDWRGARRAKLAMSLADARAESPGETRARYAFYRAGLPQPVLQHPVFDRRGSLLGVADFAWPAMRHLAEFDGLMKYTEGRDLAKEKAREDALRREGWGVTRIVWSQLRPGLRTALIEELREALESSRRQFGHLAA